jgi:hypothetical protein
MEQLICHLWGDFALQFHEMALKKTSSWNWVLFHISLYGIPLLFLHPSLLAWVVMVGTHAIIDRYRLAGIWCRWYGVGHPSWYARLTGSKESFEAPSKDFQMMLMIVVDQVFHLTINYLALSYL